MTERLIALVAIIGLGACGRSDSCLAAAQVRTSSSSGRRVATVYPGGCPNVSLSPQVTIEFRSLQGSGGAGVFAVRDSAADIRARWVGDDTLEVAYPVEATVEKRETVVRFQRERVHVVYRPLPSWRDRR
jgi:hypothetical protein